MPAQDKPQQLPFELGHREAFAREDLWVSQANAAAVGWIDKWPEWGAPALIVHGPVASGKTHVARVWQKKADATEATAGNIQALAAAKAVPLALIVDDAQAFAGDAETEAALFHVYNRQKEQGGHVLLTAVSPVRDWDLRLPDLKSRLMAAPAAQLGAPDEQLLAVVLTKLFSDRQIYVTQDVVQFIVARVERSFAAVRDTVDAIDRKAMADKRAITVPLVRDVLHSASMTGL